MDPYFRKVEFTNFHALSSNDRTAELKEQEIY